MVETASRRFTATRQRFLVLLRAEFVVHARHVEHRGIEDRMRADQAFVGQRVTSVGRLDQQRSDGSAQSSRHIVPRGSTM